MGELQYRTEVNFNSGQQKPNALRLIKQFGNL